MAASEKRQCPTCGHKVAVPERLMGRKVRCPKCQKIFTPVADVELEETDELDEVDVIDEPRRKKPRDDDLDDVDIIDEPRRRNRYDDDDDRPRRRKKKKSRTSGLLEERDRYERPGGPGKVRNLIFGGLATFFGICSIIGAVSMSAKGGGVFVPVLGVVLLLGGIGTLIKAFTE